MGAVEKILQRMEQWSSNLSVYELTRGSLLNHKLLGHTQSSSSSRSAVGPGEFAFLTSSQVRLLLLVWDYTWRITGIGNNWDWSGEWESLSQDVWHLSWDLNDEMSKPPEDTKKQRVPKGQSPQGRNELWVLEGQNKDLLGVEWGKEERQTRPA